MGFCFQNPNHQLVAFKVRDEIAFGLRAHDVDPAEIEPRTREALESVGMSGSEPVEIFDLGKGQRQRLALEPLMIAALFLILYEIGARSIDRKLLNRNLRVLVVIFLTFSAFQVFFFTPEDAHFLFYVIPGREWVPVTVQGLVRPAAVFFRFFIVVLSVHLMLYTTPPVDLVLATLERSQEIAVAILPTLGIRWRVTRRAAQPRQAPFISLITGIDNMSELTYTGRR